MVAWARPRGTDGWPWVLTVWMDQYGGTSKMSTRLGWRGGWGVFDEQLLLPADEPRVATDFWREQRAAAIVAVVKAAGLG